MGKRNFYLIVLVIFLFATLSFVEQKPTPYKFPGLLYFPQMPVNLDNPVSVEGAELGRYLFYDTILSYNNTFSCASCHKQQNAFSNSPVVFSKGINAVVMQRNTPALFNLAWYPALFWDGKAKTIEEQVFHPVRTVTEMNLPWREAEKRISQSKFYKSKFKDAFGNQKIDSVLIAKAIGQFLRTFLSYQSRYDKMLRGEITFTHDEHEGYVIVNDQTMGDCLHCHTTDANALGTTLTFSNNGLDKVEEAENYIDKGYGNTTKNVKDYGKFKIPSLRNLTLTAPYMHDGRFKTLEEVIDFYSEGVNECVNIDSKMQYAHQHGVKLNVLQKKQVLAFLKTLTDSVFINNSALSNPFKTSN